MAVRRRTSSRGMRLLVATAALFTGKATFVEWSAAVGGFVTVYIGGKTLQKNAKVKANGG